MPQPPPPVSWEYPPLPAGALSGCSGAVSSHVFIGCEGGRRRLSHRREEFGLCRTNTWGAAARGQLGAGLVAGMAAHPPLPSPGTDSAGRGFGPMGLQGDNLGCCKCDTAKPRSGLHSHANLQLLQVQGRAVTQQGGVGPRPLLCEHSCGEGERANMSCKGKPACTGGVWRQPCMRARCVHSAAVSSVGRESRRDAAVGESNGRASIASSTERSAQHAPTPPQELRSYYCSQNNAREVGFMNSGLLIPSKGLACNNRKLVRS